MKRKAVLSSNLKSVGYDKVTRTLEIEFKRGGTWTYTPVTETAYEELMASDSKGKYFHTHIQGNTTVTSRKLS